MAHCPDYERVVAPIPILLCGFLPIHQPLSLSFPPLGDLFAFVMLSLFCSGQRLTETDLMFQVSAKSPELKKTGKAPRAQGSVKEVSLPANSSNTWNRPRCGVPDYPAQKEVHYRVRNRQRRFVLYGGRLDRTDLTYRYRKCSQDYFILVIISKNNNN